MKFIEKILYPLKNNSGGGGGGDTQTVVNVPGPSEEELALQRAQLELSRQQSEAWAAMAPQFQESMAMQSEMAKQQSEMAKQQTTALSALMPKIEEQMTLQQQLAQQQMTAQQLAMTELTQALTPSEQQILNEQLEAELLGKQLSYLKGEMPTMSEQEAQQLDRLINLSKTEALSAIEKNTAKELQQASNAALRRGLGSSSIRDQMLMDVRKQALQQGAEAGRGIENLRFQAAWQLPRSQQIFEQGMTEFQSSLNQQAEANRQKLYSNLMTIPQTQISNLYSLPTTSTVFNMPEVQSPFTMQRY